MWLRKDLSAAAAAAAAGLNAVRGYEPACSTASRPASTLSPVRTLEKIHGANTVNPALVIQLKHQAPSDDVIIYLTHFLKKKKFLMLIY